ncbi:hypothetical protein IWQ60_000515 [Tieghemiomyces parasiticus]|uniref:Uncharacterized protein n=1 Tax=Tieghemiomyces parasiticus TaxID=78921 RepID=A0A9W8AGD5_9FUNG|nr:hypothetical protein IWQ60_000515 [Tieghemiomyces parasiticus]
MASWCTDFKIVLVGDANVGKSTFISRCQNQATTAAVNTSGVQKHTIIFQSTLGTIRFHVWDIAGRDRANALCDGYYTATHGVILMFDVTSRASYTNTLEWHREVTGVCGDTPMVLCGNKSDIPGRCVEPNQRRFFHERDIPYYEVSAKVDHKWDAVFLSLARQLLEDPDLKFTAAPSLALSGALANAELMAQTREDLKRLQVN